MKSQEIHAAKDEQSKTKRNIFQLFKHSTPMEIALVILGLVFSIMSGASLPLLFQLFGGVTEVYVNRISQNSSYNKSDLVTRQNDTKLSFLSSITEHTQKGTFTESNRTANETLLMDSTFHYSMDTICRLYIVIGIISFLTVFIQISSWEYSSEHRIKRLRKMYFSEVIRQDMSWFDINDNGNLSNKLADDIQRIRDGTGYKFSIIFQKLSTVFFSMAILCSMSIQLSLILVAIIPIGLGLMIYCGKVTASSAILEQQQYAIAGAVVEEALTSMKTVASFGGQYQEIKRYDEALTRGRKIAMSKYNIIASCSGSSCTIFVSLSLLTLWYWILEMQDTRIKPGSVMTIFFISFNTGFNVTSILPHIDCVAAAIGVSTVINKIISRKSVIDLYSTNGKKHPQLTGEIEFKNVNFSYPTRTDTPVLRGLNLKMEAGKTVAVVGSSGAGKSTIVNLILRFYDVQAGQLLMDGIPIQEYNVKWLRSQIGLVSQEPVLFGVSIAENISYGGENVTFEEVKNAAKKANAHDFIVKFPKGYDTEVGEIGSQLSGGQKQMIAIARALVRDPKILLLDEATSSLDTVNENLVQEALTKVMKGRTTIIVTHRLSTVKNADITYVLQNGELFESGTHDELIAKQHSLYYSLVTAQTPNSGNKGDGTERKTEVIYKQISSQELEDHLYRKYVIRNGSAKPNRNGVTSDLNQLKTVEFDGKGYCTETEEMNNVSSKTSEMKNNFEEKNGNTQKSEKIEKSINTFELLMTLSKTEWQWLLLGVISSVCFGANIPFLNYIIGDLVTVLALPRHKLLNAAISWSLTFLISSIAYGLSSCMQIKGMAETGKRLVARTRLLVFTNILRQPIGWLDQETSSPGILVNRLAQTAPLIEAAVGYGVSGVVSAVTTLVVGLIMTFLINWKLALLYIVIIPVMMGITYKQQAIRKKSQAGNTKHFEKAGQVASETIRNIRTVKALGQEALFTKIYGKHLEGSYREARKQTFVTAILFAALYVVLFFTFAISFKLGDYLYQRGEIEATDIFRIAFILGFCVNTFKDIFIFLRDSTTARSAFRLMNYLSIRKSSIDAMSEAGLKIPVEGNIEFKDVHFSYPARPDAKVLNDLSFTIEAGKTLALVGKSGCGKSTTISLLERFYDPCSGNIKIDGYDIDSLNLSHLRSHIGLVTQEPVLFNQTIRDNIAYGAFSEQANVSFDDIQEAAKIANAHDFIMALPNRYDTIAGERGAQLSGGQKQRIAIARALVRRPKILLLDEATSSLDSESEKEVQVALDKARQGRTCIIVAHRLATIQDADKICVMSHGKIVENGTNKELLELKGDYCKLQQKQLL